MGPDRTPVTRTVWNRIFGEPRRERRVRALGPAVLLGLSLLAIPLATSCGREQIVFLQVTDLLPVLDLQVGTETILPPVGPEVPELGIGWGGSFSSEGQQRATTRVRALRADLHIVAALPGDLELTLDIRALNRPEDGPQTMEILLEGSSLNTFELDSSYETISQILPAELLRPGRNLVTLDFATVGPVASDDEAARGAARVRKLEVLSTSGRPAWPERPGHAVASADTERGAERDPSGDQVATGPDLRMPTDSILDLALMVPDGARVSAELARSLADLPRKAVNRARDVFASIEIIDSNGTGTVIYEHEFGESSSDGPADRNSFDLPLEDWAGEEVLLRLRVWGGANGHVLWQHLRITCSCEDPPPTYAACDLPQVASSGRLGKPDVFIILLDAARADAFSAFGASRPTPFVDSLAAEGTKFTRAYSPSSWTGPTTASLLTGRYPGAHGVEDWNLTLPGSITTLTEMLADAGYYTFLASHHDVYRDNLPLVRGFEEIELIEHHLRSTLPGPDRLFVQDRPTFALIHLLPPHSPYEPPAPYRGLYADEQASIPDESDPALNDYYRQRLEASGEVVRHIRARYDENVAFADALVGRILEMLKNRDRYNDAIVILLADHGESFFEHGAFLHRKTLFEEVLRIPLVIKWPAGTDGYQPVVEQPASLVDVGPTLVDGLGIGAPGVEFQGISLLPATFDGATTDRAVFASTRPLGRNPRSSLALYRGQKKLILDAGSAPRLYDLSRDPQELEDEARNEPVTAQLLLQQLLAQQRCSRRLLTQAGQAPQIELDAERLRELRALGYIQ